MKIDLIIKSGACVAAIFSNTVAFTPAIAQIDPLAGLQEIFVTANKREQSSIEVPASLSALSGSEIESSGLNQMGDYLATLPGVALQDRGPGRNKIVIRGISSGQDPEEEPTTGVYLGDTPISGIGPYSVFDPKLVDIERIEVLRGPQGTLYGAGAMGGALKIIPVQPVLDAVQVKGESLFSVTEKGGENYAINATINAPLVAGKLAVRASVYRDDVSGYVDNLYPGFPMFGAASKAVRNVNDETTKGARLLVALAPTPAFLATLTGVVQDTNSDGVPESNPALGELVQARGGREGLSDNFKLLNLTLEYRFGDLELTSSTAFVGRKDGQSRSVEGFAGIPLTLSNSNNTDVFVQETRLAGSTGPLYWILGGYYSKENLSVRQRTAFFGDAAGLLVMDAIFGRPLGVFTGDNGYLLDADVEETQKAVFADGTYALTPKLSLAAGLRWFRYEQSRRESVSGMFNGFADIDHANAAAEDQFTPRLNVSYRLDSDKLIYVQAAKGFRVGRANLTAPLDLCGAELASFGLGQVPSSSDSDSLWSYEAGLKASSSNRRLQASASVFLIDWKAIQTNAQLACGFTFYSNAGKASNRGLEVEFTGLVTENLLISLSGSYNDAHLDEDAPLVTGSDGLKGDRIPGVPRYNLKISANYDRQIGPVDGYVRVDYAYVGDYYRNFGVDPRGRAGDYGLANLRIGVASQQLTFEAFAENLTDKRAVLLSDPESIDLSGQVIRRPRTIGVRFKARR